MIKSNSSFRFKSLLSAVVLGAGAATVFAGAVEAAPRNDSRDVREAKREVKEAKREVKQERKDIRKADTRAERREERQDVREAKRDVKEARQEVRQERREERRDNDNRHYDNRNNNRGNGWFGNGPGNRYGNRNDNHYDSNTRPGNDYRTLTGVVTDVQSDQRFKLRINGQVFDVFSNSRLPQGLNRGDVVRVYGQRNGNTDFRTTNISIVNNN